MRKNYHINLEIVRQQGVADRLLYSLSETFGQEAYLAGGMLRDHYFGKPGSDLDIYLEAVPGFEYDTFMEPMLNGIENLHNFKKMGKNEGSYPYQGSVIQGVYEGVYSSFNEDIPVQIIVLNCKPRDYIEAAFCCSLSKVWQTRFHNTVYTREFLDTIVSNTIEFDFSHSGNFNSDYVSKIISKFPDFKISPEIEAQMLRIKEMDSYWL